MGHLSQRLSLSETKHMARWHLANDKTFIWWLQTKHSLHSIPCMVKNRLNPSVSSAPYCSFWNSEVFSAVHGLVSRKCSKKSFFDSLCLEFEHSKRLVIDKIISSSNMMYWKVFKCELAEGSSGFKWVTLLLCRLFFFFFNSAVSKNHIFRR